MKTPGQRGPFGAWLTEQRQARYARQSDAVADIARLTGLRISPSEFAQWESGSRVPREDNPKVQRLYEFFGSRPDPEAQAQLGDTAAIVAAIDRLTAAVEAQGRSQVEGMVQLAEVLGVVLTRLGGLPAQTPGGSSEPHRAAGR